MTSTGSTTTDSGTPAVSEVPVQVAVNMFTVPCIFFLLGIGVLVPWNTFISLKSYYENRFCSEGTTTMTTTHNNNNNNNDNNNNMESIFSAVYNVSSILTMILLISIQMLLRTSSRTLLTYEEDGVRDCCYCCCSWYQGRIVPFLSSYRYFGYNTILRTEQNTTSNTENTFNRIDGSENASSNQKLTSHAMGLDSAMKVSDEFTLNDQVEDRHNGQRCLAFGNVSECSLGLDEQKMTTTTRSTTNQVTSAPTPPQQQQLQQQQQQQPVSNPTNDVGIDTIYSHHYSITFVIIPFLITIIVFIIQMILVLYVKSIPFHINMYMITLVSIAICGMTSTFLGTGIITVISTSASIIPFHQSMHPYQFGISVAGVAVSMINLLVAMTKDPNKYYTEHCHHSSSSAHALSLSSLSSLWTSEQSAESDDSNYFGNVSDSSMTKYRNVLYGFPTHHLSTCPQYNTIDYAVFSFFFIGIIILCLCLCGFLYIQPLLTCQQQQQQQQSTLYRQYVPNERTNNEITSPVIISSPTTTTISVEDINFAHPDSIDNHGNHQLLYNRKQRTHEMIHLLPTTIQDNAVAGVTTNASPITTLQDVSDAAGTRMSLPLSATYVDIFRQIYGPTGGIFITFCITLGLFPSWTAGLRSIYDCQHENDGNGSSSWYYSLFARYSNDLYVPCTFVLFNVGDLFGRIMSTTLRFGMTATTPSVVSNQLLIYAGLRLIFFPLLLLCPTSTNTSFGLTVHSDAYSLVVQLLFAISNGYVIATSFTQAPQLLQHVDGHQPQQQERMSEILSCAVNFGLFAGSLLSLLVSQLATSDT